MGDVAAGDFFPEGDRGVIYLGEADADADGARMVRVAQLTDTTVMRADALGLDIQPLQPVEQAGPTQANAGDGQGDTAPPPSGVETPSFPDSEPEYVTQQANADTSTMTAWDGSEQRSGSERRTGWTPGEPDRPGTGRRSNQERRQNLNQGAV